MTLLDPNHRPFITINTSLEILNSEIDKNQSPYFPVHLLPYQTMLIVGACAHVFFWLGSPGPIELIASRRLTIQAPLAQERKIYSYLTIRVLVNILYR